jgi:2-succinyl-6-hydroxy-2,4-cyclohexadiene-1-carboxylate synthase
MTHAVITAPSGIAYPIWQSGSGTPLVLLHGFTGSHASWQHLTKTLSHDHLVTTLDLPGHGRSEIPSEGAWTFTTVVDDLAWMVESQLGGAADVLGYSMGGRLALALAAIHPERVHRLILESASPGIADDREREVRRLADKQLAYRIQRDEIEAFVAHWEGLPMWESQATLSDDVHLRLRRIRLQQKPDGLAANLRAIGTGAQPSFWDRLPTLRTPVLLIAGELDTKFAQIARQMHEALPASQLEIVPGAGHAVHLEQPATYVRCITKFLGQPARESTAHEREQT